MKPREQNQRLQLMPGDRHDLAEVCRVGAVAIHGHPSAATLSARMDRQPGVLTCARISTGRPILGYSITYWLTAAAVEKIQRGGIQSGSGLELVDLAAPGELVAACYLSMIWRAPADERAGPSPTGVTKALLGNIDYQLRRKAVRAVVARPATTAGRSMMRSFGMQPVGPDPAGLWVVELDMSAVVDPDKVLPYGPTHAGRVSGTSGDVGSRSR